MIVRVAVLLTTDGGELTWYLLPVVSIFVEPFHHVTVESGWPSKLHSNVTFCWPSVVVAFLGEIKILAASWETQNTNCHQSTKAHPPSTQRANFAFALRRSLAATAVHTTAPIHKAPTQHAKDNSGYLQCTVRMAAVEVAMAPIPLDARQWYEAWSERCAL